MASVKTILGYHERRIRRLEKALNLTTPATPSSPVTAPAPVAAPTAAAVAAAPVPEATAPPAAPAPVVNPKDAETALAFAQQVERLQLEKAAAQKRIADLEARLAAAEAPLGANAPSNGTDDVAQADDVIEADVRTSPS